MEFLTGAEETNKRYKPGFMTEGEPGNLEQKILICLKKPGYRIECANISGYLRVAE